MDEKDITILLALAEKQNFTRVAEQLYMTQPALTSRVKRLEEDLGCTLLHRSPKGVLFTTAGQTAVEYAKTLAATTKKMRDHIKICDGDVSGSLLIGCSTQYLRFRLPTIVRDFLEKHPHIVMDIVGDRSINLLRELNRGTYSAAIIRGDFKWRGEKILLASENYFLVCKDEEARNHLQDIPYVHQKSDNFGQKSADEWVHNNLSFTPTARLESNNIEVCKTLIELGFGWAVLPEICLADFRGYKEPIVFTDGLPIVRNTYLCYQSADLVLPQVKTFIEHMISVC